MDMSLDDLIKSNKAVRRGRRQQGSAPQVRGPRVPFVGGRQRRLGVNTRASSFKVAKPFRRTKNFPWKHDLLEESLAAAGVPSIENGAKLYIFNLDYGVSNSDIRELFSEVGELKLYAIHFDRTGRPSGSAEVVYTKRSDAIAAIKRYNNVQLDGRPMKIELVSPNSEVPFSARVNAVGGSNGKTTRRVVMMRNGGRIFRSFPANRGVSQRTRGGPRNGQGRVQTHGRGPRSGHGHGRGKKPVELSAQELDQELEKYHSEGMQIS